MANFPQYMNVMGAADTSARPSTGVWGSCPLADIDQGHGIHLKDDFHQFHDIAESEVENFNGYGALVATGCTIGQLTSEKHGVIRLTHDAGNDDEVGIAQNGDVAGCFMISKNSGEPLWFEARVRSDDITNNQAWFVGLAREGAMVADAMIDDGCGAMVGKGMIGFRVIDDDNDGIDAVHNLAAEVVVTDEAQVALINTWYKLGITFDGAETLRWYVDGVLVGEADVDDTDAPIDHEMLMAFITKQGGTAIHYDMDWWECAQWKVGP